MRYFSLYWLLNTHENHKIFVNMNFGVYLSFFVVFTKIIFLFFFKDKNFFNKVEF